MVNGIENIRRLHKSIPQRVRAEVTAQLETEAQKFVQEANAIKPDEKITIGWTWGSAPAGAITVGKVANREYEKIAITIYAIGPLLEDARVPISLADVFEFGTNPRTQRSTGKFTGSMPASPYFFPTYRANRRRVRANLSRAVSRGFKKA